MTRTSVTNGRGDRIIHGLSVRLLLLALWGLSSAIGCRRGTDVELVLKPGPSASPAEASSSERPSADLDALLHGLKARLKLMPAVARWKWEHQLAIEDIERERSLTDRFVEEARTRGLEASWARRFITSQITAARLVQQDCFDRWREVPPDDSVAVVDLHAELRPQIERVTAEMLDMLVRLEPERRRPSFAEAVQARATTILKDAPITEAVSREALAPW